MNSFIHFLVVQQTMRTYNKVFKKKLKLRMACGDACDKSDCKSLKKAILDK
jgi:uncharacterized protein (DUF952 family)